MSFRRECGKSPHMLVTNTCLLELYVSITYKQIRYRHTVLHQYVQQFVVFMCVNNASKTQGCPFEQIKQQTYKIVKWKEHTNKSNKTTKMCMSQLRASQLYEAVYYYSCRNSQCWLKVSLSLHYT
jgi:hypothetical protein